MPPHFFVPLKVAFRFRLALFKGHVIDDTYSLQRLTNLDLLVKDHLAVFLSSKSS